MREGLVFVTETAVVVIDWMATLLIIIGTIEAFVTGTIALLSSRSSPPKREIWIRYARWLVVGLSFQLAADIIETSIRTDWDSIGRLAAVAVIRTFLNYFLEKDLAESREREHEADAPLALKPAKEARA